jgi:DNA topoisomerase-1
MGRLRRSDCSEPGIRRRRRGRGFSYVHEDGSPASKAERERIAALAIPPAWTDVWVCVDKGGHIQATGFDDAGRKQYLYHERWLLQRQEKKFDEMLDFAQRLPRLRRRVRADLGLRGMVRERVLASAVRLLDMGFLRLGSERYAAENETYGLATLRQRHLSIEGGTIVLDYTAKGAQRELREVRDSLLIPTLRALKQRKGGGHELLAFRNGTGRWTDVRSEDINAYIKEHAGEQFSAKDFRTWNATVLAALRLPVDAAEMSKSAREKAIRATVRDVATYLGNTPAVCRSSYIDPRVFDRFRDGDSIHGALPANLGTSNGLPRQRATVERAVCELLA